MSDPLRILSFGAGVQSSYLGRASLIGDVPKYDHAIFADTGDEPDGVYRNLEWWASALRDDGTEFHYVGRESGIAADLRLAVAGQTTSVSNPPLFIRNADGAHGMVRRKCTRDHKVLPIQAKIRQLVGVANRRHRHIAEVLAVQTFGISWDEAQRMRDPDYPWLRNDYPLVDRRITRARIVAEMAADDRFPNPARSACYHCPFHSDEEWRYLRDNEPEAFAKAIALDDDLRSGRMLTGVGITGTPYLHASRKPLAEVDFDNAEDKGQGVLFGNECEGMCGL